MVVVFRTPLTSSLPLSIVFLILSSAVTLSSPQNHTDITIDYSDYYIHQEDPSSLTSATPATMTSQPPPVSTDSYEDYYLSITDYPPRHPPRHLVLGVVVGMAALVVVLTIALLLWRFGTCWTTQAQTETCGVEIEA